MAYDLQISPPAASPYNHALADRVAPAPGSTSPLAALWDLDALHSTAWGGQ